MRNFLSAMTRNPVSLLGCAITTAAAVLIITLFGLELFGLHGSPYIGILAYLIMPAIFVGGLLMIPAGVWIQRRRTARAARHGEPEPSFPIVDLNNAPTRQIVLLVLLATMANIMILGTATYKGVEVMDTTEFCGETCHSVMHPEMTAYQRSPHARVKCVECHIGPGASWFVKSKLSGAWQVVATTFDLYPRPIPTPVKNLRPARETCEQCHWPTKFVGDKLRVLTRYAEDEANTELKTVLLLKVGGIQGRSSHGIHWHVDPQNTIRYLADPTRETIYDVELLEGDGSTKIFAVDRPEEGGEALEWRTMDCVDCHNRPTHIYRTPVQEVDAALEDGRLDSGLPFIRREAVRALNETYESQDAARAAIADKIGAFYREQYPDLAADRIEQAVRVLVDLHGKNVFPEMSVTWGTYPDHIGHTHYPGCFRCHNDLHATADGEVISQDCFTCHTLLAMEEESPEVLAQLQP